MRVLSVIPVELAGEFVDRPLYGILEIEPPCDRIGPNRICSHSEVPGGPNGVRGFLLRRSRARPQPGSGRRA
jgi:hypothetical protein